MHVTTHTIKVSPGGAQPAPCPSCGHCPHCGRGGAQQWPTFVPYPTTYPWYQPYPQLPYVYC